MTEKKSRNFFLSNIIFINDVTVRDEIAYKTLYTYICVNIYTHTYIYLCVCVHTIYIILLDMLYTYIIYNVYIIHNK